MVRFAGRSRRSEHINRRVTQSIFRGFDYADHHGRAFNLYAVINLHETFSASPVTIMERVRHKFRGWHRRATKKLFGEHVPAFYAYSIENPNNHAHANFAVHVAPQLVAQFIKLLPKWLLKSQGVCGEFDVDIQEIEEGTHKGVANYILKGTDPAFLDHFHLTDQREKHGDQGAVYGKRAGLSKYLDTAARNAANFKKRRNRVSYPINRQQPIVASERNQLPKESLH